MADYKIKFEYKGIGKQASGIRQKVLQSQKKASASGSNASQLAGARATVTALKTLNTSIIKLIASNKELAKGGGGGGIPGGGGGGRPGPGVGKIGASIPLLGAGIAALGFTIQKVNQVGNAYIDRVSQQIGNVGVGGFRRSQSVYMGAQMGAGMKAYGMATGKFSGGISPSKTALDVGAVHGLSAEETLRTAGQFKRSGGNYNKAAFIGAGAGIESDLPTLLTGMAGILTDAIREGVNTSDMSKDMAREISALTMATPGKSVEAALNIVKGFKGVKDQVSGGKMGTAQGLYTTKASQQMLMEKITGAGGTSYIQNLKDQGFITDKQANDMMTGLPEGSSFSDLLQNAPGAAFPLLRKFTAETNSAALGKRVIGNVKKEWGSGAAGLQRFSDFALTTGWNLNQSQIETAWKTGEIPAGAETTGKSMLEKGAGAVAGGRSGINVQRMQRRENLMFDYGEKFAKASVKMENAMIELTRETMDGAVAGLRELGKVSKKMSAMLSEFIKSKKSIGEFIYQKVTE